MEFFFNVWINCPHNWQDDNINNLIAKLSRGGFNPTTINEEAPDFTFESDDGGHGSTYLHHFKVSQKELDTSESGNLNLMAGAGTTANAVSAMLGRRQTEVKGPTNRIKRVISQILDELDIAYHSIVVTSANADASWEVYNGSSDSTYSDVKIEKRACEVCSTFMSPNSKFSMCKKCQEAGYTPKITHPQCLSCNIELIAPKPGACENCHTMIVQRAESNHNDICKRNKADIVEEIAVKQQEIKEENDVKAASPTWVVPMEAANGNGKASLDSIPQSDMDNLIQLLEKTVKMSDIHFELEKSVRIGLLDRLKELN